LCYNNQPWTILFRITSGWSKANLTKIWHDEDLAWMKIHRGTFIELVLFLQKVSNLLSFLALLSTFDHSPFAIDRYGHS
jgi:hypothetical protein